MAKKAKSKNANHSSGKESAVREEDVRRAVRERYSNLALSGSSCCGPSPSTMCSCGNLYPAADVISLPAEAVAVSAGCGNPTAIANLKPGMTVVDLGSGGGIDAFLAAKKVGPKGRVYGIDATHEMIMRARKTAKENGYDNVEFRLGEIEHMPLDGGIADVIISNCVINLSPDKRQVFREAFRVLKPGGKLAVSDIVLLKDLPQQMKADLGAWSECVSGAVSEKEYIEAMSDAGFDKIRIEERAVFTHDQLSDYIEGSESEAYAKVAGIDLSQLVASYKISAAKPKK
jgi:2-polyprenyl-3-methyl-5-hydroxy-6-metoxy-1,4-benzoquinol methylase